MTEAAAAHAFEPLPGNPGVDTHGHLRFNDEDGEEWLEPFDLPQLAATVLSEFGHDTVLRDDGWLELSGSGLHVLAQFVEFEVREDGLIRTVTTVQCHHPEWLPKGLFEYQHAINETFDEAACLGFRKWARTDLPVLLDAANAEASECMSMSLEIPREDGQPARKRRLLFGPVEHFGQPQRDADAAGEAEEEFCPCCLFTKSIEAFDRLLRSDELYGLRIFASRDHGDGHCQADCRVNGEGWEQALDALRAYAATWPVGDGIEYRKQYVIVQSVAD